MPAPYTSTSELATRVRGVTSVTAATTSTELLPNVADRRGATVFNDSTATLFLLLGPGTASATNFTHKLAGGGMYEVPFECQDRVAGVWDAVNGAARVTEFVSAA